jgi:phosphoribosylanthranilate isomerase
MLASGFMSSSIWIKICGVTLPSDMEMLAESGVQAVGLNFVSWSKRRIDVERARELVAVAKGRVEIVGVVADLEENAVRELVTAAHLDRVQLHGDESSDLLQRLGALAFRAIGIATTADVERASQLPGGLIVVDTDAGARSGGTGQVFDWALVSGLCRARRVVVAGGLHPENVGDAVRALRPYGVDVASGVEAKGKPGIKLADAVARFVRAVREVESADQRPL